MTEPNHFYKWLGTGHLLGVKTGDYTAAEWEALTDEQRTALAPWYKKTQRRKPKSAVSTKPPPSSQESD